MPIYMNYFTRSKQLAKQEGVQNPITNNCQIAWHTEGFFQMWDFPQEKMVSITNFWVVSSTSSFDNKTEQSELDVHSIRLDI